MSNKLDIKELKLKTKDELNHELIDLRKEQFSLRMSKSSDQNVKIHQFKIVKRNIARIKTVLNDI